MMRPSTREGTSTRRGSLGFAGEFNFDSSGRRARRKPMLPPINSAAAPKETNGVASKTSRTPRSSRPGSRRMNQRIESIYNGMTTYCRDYRNGLLDAAAKEKRVETVEKYLKEKGLTSSDARTFYFDANGCEGIRTGFRDLDFVEVKERGSLACADAVWFMREGAVPFSTLEPYQFCNHFDGTAEAIGTKVGLCQTLDEQRDNLDIDVDGLFPKCFVLTNEVMIEKLADSFILFEALATLKKYSNWRVKQNDLAVDDLELARKPVDKSKIVAALTVIKHHRVHSAEMHMRHHSPELYVDWEAVLGELDFGLTMCLEFPHKWKSRSRNDSLPLAALSQTPYVELERIVEVTLEHALERIPQAACVDEGNVWITKPLRSSQGRGIKVFNSLHKLLQHAKKENFQVVAQKYIERPLCVRGKKFDIRQWVLVTRYSPLKAYIYSRNYARVCTHDYDINDLDDVYRHLCNIALQKNSDGYHDKDNEMADEGFMMDCDNLSEMLQSMYGDRVSTDWGRKVNVWDEVVMPKIRRAVIASLKAAQNKVTNRCRSFEWLGYDFLVDEYLGVWLIECNTSPNINVRHAQGRMVRDAIKNTLELALNEKEYEDTGEKKSEVSEEAGDESKQSEGPGVRGERNDACWDILINEKQQKQTKERATEQKVDSYQTTSEGMHRESLFLKNRLYRVRDKLRSMFVAKSSRPESRSSKRPSRPGIFQ